MKISFINMKRLLLLIFIACSFTSKAQSIIGEWETYDDKTGEKLSIVEIYKKGEKYFGKIIHLFKDPIDSVCEKCEGINKNQPIIGLVILNNLEADDDEFNNGTVIDPNVGEEYDCYIELINENKLKLRGYIGIPTFGRTQYWQRKL